MAMSEVGRSGVLVVAFAVGKLGLVKISSDAKKRVRWQHQPTHTVYCLVLYFRTGLFRGRKVCVLSYGVR